MSGAEPVRPRCRHADVCGGCDWQHVAYAEQLRLKRALVRDLVAASLGASAPEVAEVVGMPPGEPGAEPGSPPPPIGAAASEAPALDPSAPWGFRRKVHFVFAEGPGGRGLVMGHYRRGSQQVIPVDECPVHAAEGNRVAFALRDALTSAGISGVSRDLSRGLARHVVVRVARGGETSATFVVTRNDKRLRAAVRRLLQHPHAPSSLHLNVHDRPGSFLFGRETLRLHGRARIREDVAGSSFLVSPTAFFQTNIEAAGTLVGLVLDAVPRACRRVLDLYAGAGLFSLALARAGHTVTAVEENAEAVDDGEESRRVSRVAPEACRFLNSRVEDAIGPGGLRGALRASPDCIVLDPPRSGCQPQVSDGVFGAIRPPRVIYVSCNPEALGADLAVAVKAGYEVARVQPVDMFPHTTHVETVAVLTRR